MERDRTPFDEYNRLRFKSKQKRQCAFFNRLQVEPDPNPCSGINTDHHVLYKSENGNDLPSNLIPLCEGHQQFVHRTNEWGSENFDELIPKTKQPKQFIPSQT